MSSVERGPGYEPVLGRLQVLLLDVVPLPGLAVSGPVQGPDRGNPSLQGETGEHQLPCYLSWNI